MHSTNTMTLHQDRYTTAQTYKYPAHMQTSAQQESSTAACDGTWQTEAAKASLAAMAQFQAILTNRTWYIAEALLFARGPGNGHVKVTKGKGQHVPHQQCIQPNKVTPTQFTGKATITSKLQWLHASGTPPLEVCLDTGRSHGSPFQCGKLLALLAVMMAHITHLLQPVGQTHAVHREVASGFKM